MKSLKLLLASFLVFYLVSCSSEKPKPPAPENFLTLADVSGSPSLKEDNPNERVITVKSKAFIKRGDLRLAKEKAIENASVQAVDAMVRELLDAENYNKNYDKIDKYMSKNLDKYIIKKEVAGEKKIFNGKYYGISAGVKVDRQKVLVALQKDLQVINTSANTLITVITSKKGVDLSSAGIKFSDLENALMNQLQTDFNQRGLRAVDFRNALASLKVSPQQKAKLGNISKDKFMALIAGSSASDEMVDRYSQESDEFYATSLDLLKKLAKVVIEINIFAVSGNINGDIALSMNVTAKNISTSTGGAFANTIVNVARRGGPNVIESAMITGLVKDSYGEMEQKFVPQVIKEMSKISVGGKKLVRYELVFKDFKKKKGRKIRKMVKNLQTDDFRYIDVDNSVPTILSVFVRYTGKTSELGDLVLDGLEEINLYADEPITAPDLTDLVFKKGKAEEEDEDDEE